ncbi:FimD/PapC C-terminal domain-containing protein, partial [Moellerella wisconsensis]|uniref:FimD/PapC C-terminal domain-containing protein n=1 Tax=Moellerella wisconsensis TaxID=158849 RepID=UPI00307609AE
LDPSTLPENVDLPQSNTNVYPTKGAVVKADFRTRIGYQVLMTLKQGAKSVPFGAIATLLSDNTTDNISSIVGDGGQVYLTGLPETGELFVKWGDAAAQQCQVNFDLRHVDVSADIPIRQVSYRCVSGQPQAQPMESNISETVQQMTMPMENSEPSTETLLKTRWFQSPAGGE